MNHPILYSFRRCPYAIRARLALLLCDIKYDAIEVDLKNKPAAMLLLSPKGTVPVLQLQDGTVIDESYDIVQWALANNYPDKFLLMTEERKFIAESIYTKLNKEFIFHLNRFKYPDRYADVDKELHTNEIISFLNILNLELQQHDFLCGSAPSYIDILVFPFIRQLRIADADILTKNANHGLLSWFSWWSDSTFFQEVIRKV